MYFTKEYDGKFSSAYGAVAFSLKTAQENYDGAVRVNLHFIIKPLENCWAKKILPIFSGEFSFVFECKSKNT